MSQVTETVKWTGLGRVRLIEGEPYVGGDAIEVDGRDLAETLAQAFAGEALVVGTINLPGTYKVSVERIS